MGKSNLLPCSLMNRFVEKIISNYAMLFLNVTDDRFLSGRLSGDMLISAVEDWFRDALDHDKSNIGAVPLDCQKPSISFLSIIRASYF